MKNEKVKSLCQNCGANMVAYWHTLSPGIVRCLLKFSRAVNEKGRNHLHLLKDLNGENKLTEHEWNNFTHLRFFALVAKAKDEAGNRATGYWLLTSLGSRFLRGITEVPARVLTYRNVVQRHDDRTLHIREFYRKHPEFETVFDWEVVDGKVVKIRNEEGKKVPFKVGRLNTMPKEVSACCHANIAVDKKCTSCGRIAFRVCATMNKTADGHQKR